MKNTNYSIPKRAVWSVIDTIAIVVFAYIQAIGYIIPGWYILNELKGADCNINNIGLMWIPIIAYLIIATFVCTVVRIFKELKPYKEEGLKMALQAGFVFGFLFGLVFGLTLALKAGFVFGFLFCLVPGLILGLIMGLIVGLIKEFN